MRMWQKMCVLCVVVAACATAPKTAGERRDLQKEADSAMQTMFREDASLGTVVEGAYAHAIFPSVGRGGLIVGGGFGRGVVYRQGRVMGYADVSAAEVGMLAGGQTVRELLVFQTEQAFNELVNNRLRFTAEASAVAVKSGAAAQTQFQNGVVVFVQPTGGLMGSLGIGGQSFSYVPPSATAP